MRACLLSYQANHRKTFDVIAGLKARGYSDVCVYAKQYHYNKSFKPIYEHRPALEFTQYDEINYREFINNYGYDLRDIDDYKDINQYDEIDSIFLVCGAGIIPKEIYDKYTIINSHPGYIPNCRGLDAYKWAIVEKQPIGVTTHIIGDYVDAGDIIAREEVPINGNDTFHSVAYRVYHLEVKMLIDAVENHSVSFQTEGEGYDIHKRMPPEIETGIIGKFNKYKNNITRE